MEWEGMFFLGGLIGGFIGFCFGILAVKHTEHL